MSNNNENKKDPLLCHWADQMADKIIREKGDLDSYTCASGITPSGTVHLGNFREIITVDLVVRALRDRGKKVRFIYSWDDYDVFRKVPANMPDPEILEKISPLSYYYGSGYDKPKRKLCPPPRG